MTGLCPYGNHPFEYELLAGKRRTYCSDDHQRKAAHERKVGRRSEDAERWCPYGQHVQPSSEFSSSAPYCRPCMAAHARERRKINGGQDPKYTRMLNLRRYGLTLEQFDELLASQGGRCAVCRTDAPGGLGWHVDHDHTCCSTRKISCGRCVRGILCTRCNIGIGNFKDDPAIIQAAIDYIAAYRRWRTQWKDVDELLRTEAAP